MRQAVRVNPFALLEAPRALLEMSSLAMTGPLLSQFKRGDGHGVMVIPGLGASDRSTYLLRRFLDSRGYLSSGWGLEKNLGIERSGGVEQLLRQFDAFQQRCGGKISLIGWSLGGVHARHLASLRESAVRQVICLGSPINSMPMESRAWQFYERANEVTLDEETLDKLSRFYRTPLNVPITSIYSRSDGVVPWPYSIEKNASRRDNIELVASHIGLGVNPSVFYVISDRLAQAEDDWQPFDRSRWLNRLVLTSLNPLGEFMRGAEKSLTTHA